MDRPEWLLRLPVCTVDGQPARYIPPAPAERARGVVAVWLDEGHPYANPNNPGGVGSALMVRLDRVSFG